jgi:hypothetical protein
MVVGLAWMVAGLTRMPAVLLVGILTLLAADLKTTVREIRSLRSSESLRGTREHGGTQPGTSRATGMTAGSGATGSGGATSAGRPCSEPGEDHLISAWLKSNSSCYPLGLAATNTTMWQ